MSILLIIKTAIKKVFGPSEPQNTAVTKPEVNNNKDAIINGKKPENNDLYVGRKDSDLTDEDKDKIRFEINNKITAIDSKIAKLAQNGEHLTKADIKEIRKLYFSVKEQMKTLGLVEKLQMITSLESALDEQIELARNGEINEDADVAAILEYSANNNYNVLTSGAFKNLNQAKKFSKKSKLHKDEKYIDKMTDEQREEYFANLQVLDDKEIEAKVQKLPKNQQDAERKKLQAQNEYVKKSFMVKSAYTKDTRFVMSITLNLGPQVFDSYLESISFGVNSRKAGEARQKAADMQDFDYHVKMKQNYLAQGKDVSSEDFETGVQMSAQNQSIDGLNNLNNGINEARKRHKETGVLPAGLAKEDLTSMSAAVGAGAHLNQNLSVDQKADFLNKFEKELLNYDDHDVVMQRVDQRIQEYISKLPPDKRKEVEAQVQQIKSKIAELKKQESSDEAVENKSKKDSNLKSNKQQTVTIHNTPLDNDATIHVEKTDVPSSKYVVHQDKTPLLENEPSNNKSKKDFLSSDDTFSNNNILISNSGQYITRIISKTGSVTRAISDTSLGEVAHEVFTNPSLASYIPEVALKFKGEKDVDFLQRVSNGCSSRAYLALLRVLDPIVAGKLYDKTCTQRGYDLAKLGENIVEKTKENDCTRYDVC